MTDDRARLTGSASSRRSWSSSRRTTGWRWPAGSTGRPAPPAPARSCSACTAARRRRSGRASSRSTRCSPRPVSRCSRRTCAARPGSAGPSCTPTTATGATTPIADVRRCAEAMLDAGVADPGAVRCDRSLLRRLPHADGAGPLRGRVRRRCRRLRDERPAELLPRHRAVDRRGGGDASTAIRRTTASCCTTCPRCSTRTGSPPRCSSCTASSTPTCRSVRRARWSPRCADWSRPVSYLELAGEGHEYRRRSSRRLLIETVTDFLTRTLG